MKATRSRRLRRAALLAASAVGVAATVLGAGAGSAVASPVSGQANPIVRVDGGLVRGAGVARVDSFLGLPYAAPPTGNLRWRPPQPAAWSGVRDATQFGPSCPQQTMNNPYLPPGPISEDCLYLNVYTPTSRSNSGDGRPVLVWIHGGGLVQDGARNYDGSKLAADGTVVVTINYRLGALGFLAHPAFASRPGGPAGNYGLMDQQAALRWIQRNIARFGGDPHNVTIAGQSAGGLSVLAQLVSPGGRGLFQRAIVQSGSFALTQQPLVAAEAAGEKFATAVGCTDQTARCLRRAPVSDLVSNFGVEIPGVVDGSVLTQSIGMAIAHGHFARVPILNGITHDEEMIFVDALGIAVSGGTDVPVPDRPVSSANYETNIASVLGVSDTRAAAIAAEYPPGASPDLAFSTLVADANFACPALQLDRWTSSRVPTYAYQFNDDHAPVNVAPPGVLPPIATHGTELPYLFDQPNAPHPAILSADQQALAASMRAAWANFAARGDPSSRALPWPSFGDGAKVLSLVPMQSTVETDFAAAHHCAFWAAG
ncbi:MAG: carboxylesterase family protein [Actinomycetia bacterium]|nr:carboxylesterase family protein [Actinomycetes bacterium]